MNSLPLLVIICGPTAVGKTEFAIRMANRYQSHIVSADARQFYKEMHIGTAKPSQAELDRAPHHLVGHISIFDEYDAAKFEEQALAILDKLFQQHNPVFVSGGSGLFIKALSDGFDTMPQVAETIRKQLMDTYNSQGLAPLLKELEDTDPDYYAEVDLHNPQRIIRALEVIRESGKPFSSFRKKEKKLRPFRTLYFVLNRDKAELYERINHRVEWMMDEGLEEEARNLFPHSHLNALQTVGYSELFHYFEGKLTKEEAIELIKRNSRRYAKRQLTWFRKLENAHWLQPSQFEEACSLIDNALAGK
jgi:tRNA dimethylallyltransferase